MNQVDGITPPPDYPRKGLLKYDIEWTTEWNDNTIQARWHKLFDIFN